MKSIKLLYKILTVSSEHTSWSSYNVLATTAEEAIEKTKPQLDKNGQEWIEEIEVLGIVDVE